MQLPKRSFEISPARRHNVPLLFGLFAIWDGGKTVSGIRVGRGMAEVLAGDADSLHVIDTEGNRALAYADRYKFQHVPFAPPHGSLDYLAAINQCVDHGAKVIMIDTVTHEHYGIGGYLDTIEAAQYELLKRWQKEENARNLDKVRYSAINVASAKRKELVRHIEQLGRSGVALIFCFRASEKVKPRKKGDASGDDDSKMVEMGYMPDTKESLMFLMTASALLMPRAKGVPTWHPEKPGEKIMVKVPGQFEGLFRDGEQLNEEHGRAMARWHKGETVDGATKGSAPIEQRVIECMKFLEGATTSAKLKQRYGRAETVTLLSACNEKQRLQIEAKYGDLLDSLLERESIAAESR